MNENNEQLRVVAHRNFIGHEINESLNNGYPASDREVFCKKRGEVCEPMKKDCDNCNYFAGWMGGYGHQCAWEDVRTPDGSETMDIDHHDAKHEMLRVAELVDQGILKKG